MIVEKKTKYDSKLWNKWVKVCNEYLKAFCKKHGYDYEDATRSWVGDFDGTMVFCGDECASIEDIIIDIEENAPEEEFQRWQYYCVECAIHGCKNYAPNYESWLKGIPRITTEEMDKKAEIKQMDDDEKIRNLKAELNKDIDEYLGRFS